MSTRARTLAYVMVVVAGAVLLLEPSTTNAGVAAVRLPSEAKAGATAFGKPGCKGSFAAEVRGSVLDNSATNVQPEAAIAARLALTCPRAFLLASLDLPGFSLTPGAAPGALGGMLLLGHVAGLTFSVSGGYLAGSFSLHAEAEGKLSISRTILADDTEPTTIGAGYVGARIAAGYDKTAFLSVAGTYVGPIGSSTAINTLLGFEDVYESYLVVDLRVSFKIRVGGGSDGSGAAAAAAPASEPSSMPSTETATPVRPSTEIWVNFSYGLPVIPWIGEALSGEELLARLGNLYTVSLSGTTDFLFPL